MDSTTIRIHSFLEASLSNGPGRRAVLWVQGCTLGCPDCFNPETYLNRGGEVVPISSLVHRIQNLSGSLEGITISGGEPLQQRRPLESLLKQVRSSTSLSVILFSGYTWDEINRIPGIHTLLTLVDILIAGRYDSNRRLAQGLIGSANKTVHFLSDRYSWADLSRTAEAEVMIDPGGEIILSGIDPLRWSA
ncbi:MAG TPA: 4Fe-4S single cluster domain-containing protein [Anaerolineaceae bacterium]|nr:4Fe-4S single cluster domain-containing protein [Anaerolineaceae bacterium]